MKKRTENKANETNRKIRALEARELAAASGGGNNIGLAGSGEETLHYKINL
jgi:hypothetical protein